MPVIDTHFRARVATRRNWRIRYTNGSSRGPHSHTIHRRCRNIRHQRPQSTWNHFFESVLPNPSGDDDDDFPDKLPRGEFEFLITSCLGGASFLIFITRSTILVPTSTGLTLSFALACSRLKPGTGNDLPLLREEMVFAGRPLAGEHDCRLTRSTDEDRGPGLGPGRPRAADGGRSATEVLKLGGASSENPGISEGFHILGRTVGDLGCVGPGVPFVGRRVGVEAREVVLAGGGALVVVVGTVDRVGVEDLLAAAVGRDEEIVGREVVGVEDREGFDDDVAAGADRDDEVAVGLDEVAVGFLLDVGREDVEVKVGRLVGVEGLEPGPLEEDGRRDGLLREVDFRAVGRAFGVPTWLVTVLCFSISSEGNRGVPGELRKLSGPVFRPGADVAEGILNIGEVPCPAGRKNKKQR
ncbi:copper amine oxidase family protein [Striga asiatica]|uniref:Copper amine oxidase family protein n=1 Tax=Striga asiatica TaxID=4170 RepID=A0A5A7QMU0_STRAF|nr:copper amine oxidase family protein [Striga asiatica]